jgi:hypothetical protein
MSSSAPGGSLGFSGSCFLLGLAFSAFFFFPYFFSATG